MTNTIRVLHSLLLFLENKDIYEHENKEEKERERLDEDNKEVKR
jgi:hypothetical protein